MVSWLFVDSPTIKITARVSLRRQKLAVTFSRQAHNPILRAVAWHQSPQSLSWLNGAELEHQFKLDRR
jgi:hypothetical protein